MGLHSKYRVHEVSKDFNLKSNDILALLTEKFGESTNSHMTALTDKELDYIFDYYTQNDKIKDFALYFSEMDRLASERKIEEAKLRSEKEKQLKAQEEEKKRKEEEARKAAEEKAAAEKEAEEKAAAEKAAKEKAAAEKASREKAAKEKAAAERAAKDRAVARDDRNKDKKARFERFSVEDAKNQQKKDSKDSKKTKERSDRQNTIVPRRVSGDSDEKITVIDKDITSENVKVVDTRTAVNVNLSKYDERLNDIVGERANRDYDKSKQKIKNKNKSKSQYDTKREDETAKLKRLEQYEKDRKKHLANVVLPEQLSVSELAAALRMTNAEVVKKLMLLGIMASAAQIIDYDTAALVAEEFGAKVSKQVVVTIEDKLIDDTEDADEQLEPRSPVVVVMGHVDHGKTSLLDAIRHTNVTQGEAGGITQHIGAYTVTINDRSITFLDTPGHAAFTSMRARGAQVTDIVILVVAGDDGIMPQTVEAINHSKAAGVPIIVAVNKMDKPEANYDRVLQSLTEYELVPEQWGGDTICVPVSAVTGEGIEQLLEMVQLVADVRELKANPNRKAKGTVIEAKLDKGRGPVATVLVQNGTLRPGDVVVAGTSVGRIRNMLDDKGRRITAAAPSTPVEVTGFSDVPSAGDLFYVVDDERMARELVEQRKHDKKEEASKVNTAVSLDDLFSQIKEGSIKDLNIIVKADVQGSAEAVKASLEKLSNDEVRVRVIHSAVGGITESDVMLATASNAIIVGFNVRPDPNAKVSAEKDGVDMRLYRVIYDCINEIEAAMKGMLAPKFREVSLGMAEVRQTFRVSGVGTIAGCYVKEGRITRSAEIRLIRDGIVVHEGKIDSLKRFKDDASEVKQGYECGIGIERFGDVKEGDIIEAFVNEEIKQ
ncbi:MAG: translation initiation factor IF-2 [Clostridia bacterium]|nr:translation initiation factor IF-2 [Clostridia bacterium]